MLVGTISVALVAMVFAFPTSVLMALYISEYAPARIKSALVSLIDLMAAVPSIVYGLWGFFLIMPHAAELSLWLQRNLGWIPFFEVDTDPDAAVWDTTRYVVERVLRRHRGRDDGDADGVRGDAPGLLPDPAR